MKTQMKKIKIKPQMTIKMTNLYLPSNRACQFGGERECVTLKISRN